jgi:hypothetical protein
VSFVKTLKYRIESEILPAVKQMFFSSFLGDHQIKKQSNMNQLPLDIQLSILNEWFSIVEI